MSNGAETPFLYEAETNLFQKSVGDRTTFLLLARATTSVVMTIAKDKKMSCGAI